MKLVDILRVIKSNPNIRKGICDNYRDIFVSSVSTNTKYYIKCRMELHKVLEKACIDWEHFSGNITFPVKHPTLLCINGFDTAFRTNTLWEGEYGRRRMELLNRMIAIAETLE